LRTDIEDDGDEVGAGKGMADRTAMMAASAKAQDVKKPNAF
jgi:hypothetical protein